MPTSLLDKIRTALRRTVSTLPQLADALTDARKVDADARAAVERQVAAVSAGYLDDDAKRAKARATLADLRADAEDAALVLAEVERRHAAALAEDEQERRRAVYAGAKAQADAAALALAKTYPKLAAGMVAMLKELAEAQQAVAAANVDLPDGAVPLIDPEMSARAVPAELREVTSDEWIEAWGSVEATVPLADEYQAQIYDCGNGWGKRGHYEGGKQTMGEPKPNYRRRRFRKITYREASTGTYPTPLAATIRLPAARGAGMLWGNPHLMHDPALAAAMLGEGEPGNVLARIADLDAAAVARPVKAERALRVEYPEFAEVVPFPPEQPIDLARVKPPNTGSRFGASPFAKPGARAGARR